MSRNFNKIKHNVTKKTIKVHGHINQENNEGWLQITIKGTPQQRGFAHGFLLHRQIEQAIQTLPFLVKHEIETSYKHYLNVCKRTITPIVKEQYPEFYQEIEAIIRGVKYQNPNTKVTTDLLVAWNAIMSMYEYIHNKPQPKKRCSAFIATGTATKTGQIVMGHTTHTDLVSGALFNIILYMIPDKGIPFTMQTAPGCIASGTDWFLTESNIIGCETTIGDIKYRPIFDKTHHPYFCRIRQAMQYAHTLNQYAEIMTKNNAGDYACSWLFGNTKTNEIMLCELGLHETNVQTKKNGIYYGMNSAMSAILRNQETSDQEFFDMTTSSGARNARFQQLFEKYNTKLDEHNTIDILSDHVDPFTQKECPSAKTICAHSYNDKSLYEPYYPHGCTDLKVTTTKMAKEGKFLARFGPACGYPFSANEFIKKHPKYREFKPYLENMPTRKIVTISTK